MKSGLVGHEVNGFGFGRIVIVLILQKEYRKANCGKEGICIKCRFGYLHAMSPICAPCCR